MIISSLMPLALFLITVLISSSMYTSVSRVSQDAFVNQHLLTSTAAFYTASSSAEVTWSSLADDTNDSTAVVATFIEQSTDTSEGASPAADELAASFTADAQEGVELNLGVQSHSAQRERRIGSDLFVLEHRQSSAEVFLQDVPADQVVSHLQVDFCRKGEPDCPLIVEWFRIQKGAWQFQTLQTLKDEESDTSPLSVCLDMSSVGIERCVVRTAGGPTDDLDISAAPAESDYQYTMRLPTLLSSYDYLFRFRSVNKEAFHFQMYGLRGADRAPLPTAFVELDELGRSRQSFRRIRQRKAVSGGLQDGLEFVHFAETVANK